MRKDAREIDQLVKQIEQAALLGAEPPRDLFAAALRHSHELLANDERLDDQNLVAFQQAGDLRANGGQAAMLNFDEPVAAHPIDPIAGDSLFHTGLAPRGKPSQMTG